MRLPRDVAGADLAGRLRRFGYAITRQTGSHLRLTSAARGAEHHISIPLHRPLKVGTLSAIISDVASYLELERDTLVDDLFKR